MIEIKKIVTIKCDTKNCGVEHGLEVDNQETFSKVRKAFKNSGWFTSAKGQFCPACSKKYREGVK